MKIKKVIFLSLLDPTVKKSWSGTNYFILQALQSAADEVEVFTGFKTYHTFFLKVRFLISKFLGYNFYYDHTNEFTQQYSRQINERLLNDKESIIFTTNGQFVVSLKVENKIVLYNDGTLANQYGYYDYFSNLNFFEKRQAFKNERKALQKADILLFASDWAANSAINDFHIDSNKVHVVPFGANLINIPNLDDVKHLIQNRTLKILNLLWIGVDFERKGGAIALEVVRKLNERGISATLTMVGISDIDKNYDLPPFVQNIGAIDKDAPGGEELLIEFYKKADFFILPSQRECFGVVFAEACAFGLPILAIETGGVPTIVTNGKNGWLFPKEQAIDGFTEILVSLSSNLSQYQQHCEYARHAFDEKLNWQIVSKTLKTLLWSAG
jgi:glycosyltransferase involved in cell wall biosynthesis